jgi:hypothetical protein
VRTRLDQLIEATGADELMVSTMIYDHGARQQDNRVPARPVSAPRAATFTFLPLSQERANIPTASCEVSDGLLERATGVDEGPNCRDRGQDRPPKANGGAAPE